jgi:alkyldihydroxyacetonephosphate synthase
MSRRRRSFFGWGYEDEPVSTDELGWFERAWSQLFHVDAFEPTPLPRESEITLRSPRISVPQTLASFCSHEKYDRLLHCYGRSVHDLARMIHRRDFANPPDVVAYPRDELEIQALLGWCGENEVAAIPFGGGSSVVGGVNPAVDEHYRGTLTIDLKHLNRVIEVDAISQTARIQAGVLGPDLERQLKPSGLTMRFFLQAWEFSSLGGWIATRAAGHYATVYTQIDDHVESLAVVTPAGTMQTRRWPTSGAGPNPDRLFLGSEGALGIITQAWVRLHRRPIYRSATTVRFSDYQKAVETVRAISQAGLYPANARLIEREEAQFTERVKGATLRAIKEVTGRPGTCTVRFTHLYPDGPAPYFTWHALGDKARLVEQFWDIKAAASEAMVQAGGTITHHHALGRDHRRWYDRERPELFADALKAIKQRLDPHHIMNPGVLIDA